mgnify:CR=1 FL=1
MKLSSIVQNACDSALERGEIALNISALPFRTGSYQNALYRLRASDPKYEEVSISFESGGRAIFRKVPKPSESSLMSEAKAGLGFKLVLPHHSEKVIAAVRVLIEEDIISSAEIPLTTEREFTLQYPELAPLFNLLELPDGSLALL